VCASTSKILKSEFDNQSILVDSLLLEKWFARGNTLEGLWANPSLFKCRLKPLRLNNYPTPTDKKAAI